MDDVIQQIWHAMPNDLIGGWSVMNVHETPAMIRHSRGEVEVALFTSKEVAEHIAELHNLWLTARR